MTYLRADLRFDVQNVLSPDEAYASSIESHIACISGGRSVQRISPSDFKISSTSYWKS